MEMEEKLKNPKHSCFVKLCDIFSSAVQNGNLFLINLWEGVPFMRRSVDIYNICIMVSVTHNRSHHIGRSNTDRE